MRANSLVLLLWVSVLRIGLGLVCVWGQRQVGSHVSCSLLVLAVLSTMCQASDKNYYYHYCCYYENDDDYYDDDDV